MQAWEGHPPLPTEQLSFLLCLECSSHIITAQLCSPCIHWPAASTASWSLQGSRARLQGALGFTQVFWGNLIPGSAASSLCCASWCIVPSPGSFIGHGHHRDPGISMEPWFLQPCCTSSQLKQSWSSWMLLLCPGGGLGAVTPKDGEEIKPGTFPMAPSALLQQRNQCRQGCGSSHFLIRKNGGRCLKSVFV